VVRGRASFQLRQRPIPIDKSTLQVDSGGDFGNRFPIQLSINISALLQPPARSRLFFRDAARLQHLDPKGSYDFR
jgi:hypothetical protein